jgi:heptosyltransferase-2
LAGDGAIVGVMRPYVAEVLSGNCWFDDTILYAKKAKSPDQAWPAVRQRLRDAKLDAVVLLTNSLRTGWMAYQSGAAERIGNAGNLRSALLTVKVHRPRRGWRGRLRQISLPTVLDYLNVSLAAGCGPESHRLELATTAVDEAAADRVWERLGLRSNDVAVFNTGGAFGAAKDWPAEHFAKLARRLAEERGLHVLINCGPAERESARAIATAAGHPHVVSLADEEKLPIGLTKAAIRRAGLLVTTDSGPRFFGVAFGVPTVTLFGPTSTEFTRTYAEHEVSVSLRLDCQPCMARTCPLAHHRCMRDLSVDRVWGAVDEALNFATVQQRAA